MRRGAAAVAAAVSLTAAVPAHATLAYVRGLLRGEPVVWVAADDGTSARALARGFFPRVSPDGTQVAYVAGGRRTALMVGPVAGGPARTVARSVWNYDAIAWAPDGTRIAVTTGPELGPYTLRVVDLAGGTARRIARGYFQGASFAPDGSGIAFARALSSGYPPRANLYVASLGEGGGLTRLTDDGNAGFPAWGPERIGFSRARAASRRGDHDKLDLYTVRPDGTGLRRLTRTRPPFLLAGLTAIGWSADGGRLAAQYTGQDTAEAWRVDAASGRAADATGGFAGVAGWAIARDGSALLATSAPPDDLAGDVVAIAWDGGARTVLARRAAQPSWSR